MTIAILSADHMSDQELLALVRRAAASERRATVQLVALLMELDARKLYLAEGCSSLFTYCRQILHLSEHAAYGRIEAARAARKFPIILERLAEGTLHLTAIGLLAPHLTRENHLEVLNAAGHKSKREVEELVARLRPKPDVPAIVCRLPERRPLSVARLADTIAPNETAAPLNSGSMLPTPPNPPAEVKPLAPERYKVQFTVSRETYDQLQRAQDLMRHTIPDSDPGAIFERALTVLVRELEKSKLAATERPRPTQAPVKRSRTIPAAVRRAVWKRDEDRCAFVGPQGRCTETSFLELHHVIPFAAGGKATIENISLRCRSHNQYEARQEAWPGGPLMLREHREPYRVGDSVRTERGDLTGLVARGQRPLLNTDRPAASREPLPDARPSSEQRCRAAGAGFRRRLVVRRGIILAVQARGRGCECSSPC